MPEGAMARLTPVLAQAQVHGAAIPGAAPPTRGGVEDDWQDRA
jgi:hypothetical protein